MANSNKIISSPVAQYADARAVTQNTAKGLIALCTSGLININSKCKPQSVALSGEKETLFFSDQAAREAAFKRTCYGLTNIPCFTRAMNMMDWMMGQTASTYPTNMVNQGKANAWSWRKPTINRQGDFNKYDQLAQPLVTGYSKSKLIVPMVGTAYLGVNTSYRSTEITIRDLCSKGVWLPYGSVMHSDASNPTNLHLGLCIVNSSTTSRRGGMIVREDFALNESSDVTFSFLATQFANVFTAPNGTYTIFVFLCAMDVLPIGLTRIANQTGVFYPINCSEVKMTIAQQSTELRITVSGSRDTETSKTVNGFFQIYNASSDFGIYISARLELVSVETVNGVDVIVGVIDTYYIGGRRYLAPKDAITNGVGGASMNGSSMPNLKIRAVVEVYETDTAFQPIETIETTPKAITVGILPLPDVN